MHRKILKYLAHGNQKSGGAVYENILLDCIKKFFEESKTEIAVEKQIVPGVFKKFQNLKLLIYGFRQADAEVNLVVARFALTAVLRNIFSKRKVLIVLHNFDEKDNKSKFLKYYYSILFSALNISRFANIAVICVSPFFKDFFQKKIRTRVILFPNLFDTEKILAYRTSDKKKQVHLGQWSKKNSEEVFILAEKLSVMGYDCFFTTLDMNCVSVEAFYSVRYYDSYQKYLETIAACICTIAFTKINEGWNRIAHESILAGTPVIGFDKGGLGDLLRESDSYCVQNADEALTIIREGCKIKTSAEFYSKYDIKNFMQSGSDLKKYLND